MSLRLGWKFFRSFLRSPAQMGGVIPSSKALARAVAETVKELLEGPQTPLIEVGPGTGALTEELVRLANLVVLLERNPEFAEDLRQRFSGPEVRCEDFLTTALFATGNRGAVVVSSLPIRSLPHPELFRARFRELLLSGSVRAVVQFSYGWRDPLGLGDLQILASRRRWVLWNLPPAFVWTYRLKG
ncbi:MAG: hypothetical protein KGQ59_07500 [Bdellovibrionales bacterium]|nr:hypothetical protein [Bdellovibrionales bacterium]